MEKSTEFKIKEAFPKIVAIVAILLLAGSCYDSIASASKITELNVRNVEITKDYQTLLSKESSEALLKEKALKSRDSLIKVNSVLTAKTVRLEKDIVLIKQKNKLLKESYEGKDYNFFATIIADHYNSPENVISSIEGVSISGDVPRFIAEDLADLETNTSLLATTNDILRIEKDKNTNLLSNELGYIRDIYELTESKNSRDVIIAKSLKLSEDQLKEISRQRKLKELAKWTVPVAFVLGAIAGSQ